MGRFPQEQGGTRASRIGLALDTERCGAGPREGPVYKGLKGGRAAPRLPGKLAQEDFTYGCGWVPQAAKGESRNWD